MRARTLKEKKHGEMTEHLRWAETLRRDLKINRSCYLHGWGQGRLGRGASKCKGSEVGTELYVRETERRPVWQLNAIRPDIRELFGCT